MSWSRLRQRRGRTLDKDEAREGGDICKHAQNADNVTSSVSSVLTLDKDLLEQESLPSLQGYNYTPLVLLSVIIIYSYLSLIPLFLRLDNSWTPG